MLPGIAARYPRAAGAGLAVAEAWLAGPAEIAVVGPPDDERTRALHQTALHAAPPGAVLALGDGTSKPAGIRRAAARRARAWWTERPPRTSAASSPARPRSPPRSSSGRRSPGPPDPAGSPARAPPRARRYGVVGDMLALMHSLADAVRRLWRRVAHAIPGPSARPRRLVPVMVSLLAVAGAATGAVLATVGGKPAGVGALSPGIPQTRPAASTSIGPVVPMLGGNADGSGKPIGVPVAELRQWRARAPSCPFPTRSLRCAA